MCNAWNHSFDCTCGWGGEGHLGRRYIGNSSPPIFHPKFKTYNEFLIGCTIPNARCPVCGKPVFFYRSPSNGRVFFDELGPPWPKHPCTSNQYEPILVKNTPDLDSINVSNSYYVNKEWKPFLLEGIFKVDPKNNISEIIGYIEDRRRTFFTKINGLTADFPFFIKESPNETRLLTFVEDPQNYILEFIVKIYRSDLIESILNIGTRNMPQGNIKVKRNPHSVKSRQGEKSKKKDNHVPQKNKHETRKPQAVKLKLTGKLQDQLSKLKRDLLKD